jgi:hypothetical protein
MYSPCEGYRAGSPDPAPLRMLLTWHFVPERIGFFAAYSLLQWINGTVIGTRDKEAQSFRTTITVQCNQHHAIGCDTDSLGVPGTEAENLVLRAYLRILVCARFINQ